VSSPVVIVTAEHGRYVLDCATLLSAMTEAVAKVRADTARYACAIQLHQDDALELARYTFGDSCNDPMTAFGGIPIRLENSVARRRGVAEILQCPMAHLAPEDCVYHARSRRRLGMMPQ
jgi:hypothetical protein